MGNIMGMLMGGMSLLQMLGGGGGLGMLGMLSDRRLKTATRLLHRYANGIGAYAFRFLWDTVDTVRVGVMADEVIHVIPDAVETHPTGYLMVNYNKLGAAS
jgi:hypothetical protein